MNQTNKKKLPILKRHFGSNAGSIARYLRPEAIYSLNRVLYEFLDTLGIKGDADKAGFQAWIVPNLFDQYTRSWHFACVLPHAWGNGQGKINEEFFPEMLWLLTKIVCRNNLFIPFQAAENNLLVGEDYLEAYKRVAARVATLKGYRELCLQKCTALSKDDWEGPFGIDTEQEGYKEFIQNGCAELVKDELSINNDTEKATLVRDFMLIYHGYRTHRGLYLQGILYRYLMENQDVVIDRFEGATDDKDFATVNGSFISFGDESSPQTQKKYHQFEFILGKEKFDKCGGKGSGIDLGFALMLPFYLREALQQQTDHKANEILVLPIHDVWLGNIGYGGLWGCLLCTFPEGGREKFVNPEELNLLSQIKPVCEALSAELTMSALATIASREIVPSYDLVEHFIRMIIHVQDWEHISVYRHEQLLYCYVRVHDKNGQFTWERREPSQNECCSDCDSPEKSDHKVLTWKGLDIWSQNLMPELSDEDKTVFRDIVLEFEFPKTATVPRAPESGSEDCTLDLFKFAVIQRQIEVLRALIPKVRARRAALRSAVSAIMGRNMSHNIGSHVLARYSSAIKHDLDPANKDNTDHRTDFLGYLQRRMDFLAEVATSDKAFWEQPLSLKDALSKLNYKTQADRIAIAEVCKEQCTPAQESDAPCKLKCARLSNTDMSDTKDKKKNEPILLSYITGKESLVANVEWGNPPNTGKEQSPEDTPYFSCPGGEVGVHALYVILENIIRNSARHAKSNGGESVDVYVSVCDNSEAKDNLIKLTIIDSRTTLDKNGCVIEQEERAGSKSLTAHINEILTKEPFLNEDSSTNPKYWGVREMQICAHYLRGLPLGDLEGKAVPPTVLAANPWKYLKDGEPGYFLAYTLYLKRAQLLAYIEALSEPKDKERDKKLLSRGIKPIYRDKVESKEKSVDWKKIADESRGYSFLVLPPDLKSEYDEKLQAEAATEKPDEPLQPPEPVRGANEAQQEERIKHILPVRVVEKGNDKIKKLVEHAENSIDLCGLHEAMIKKYRTNGQDKSYRWGAGNIYAVAGWFGNQQGNSNPVSLSDGLHYWPVSKVDEGEYRPFSTLPGELPVLENNVQPEHLGLAWLDHANDADLMWYQGGGNPRSASFKQNYARNWASIEPLWSDSLHRQVLMDTLPEGMSELAAAALARVVVLDERIQSRRHDIVRAVTLRNYWPQAGIWCPLHPHDVNGKTVGVDQRPIVRDADAYHKIAFACDLDEPKFADIQSFLKEPTKVAYQLPADFLVLHLTILERLNKQQPEESINKTLTELVRGTQCEQAQIIIVTGRGVPTAALHRNEDGHVDARYLPISALQEFLVTRPSKLGLMRALWAAAAPAKQS